MNQEEEAKRIIQMFLPYVDNQENDIETSREVADYNTKQCALIYVNGKIDEVGTILLTSVMMGTKQYSDVESRFVSLKKVKSIIESK